MKSLIGQVLRDRYRIQSLLGRQTGRRTFLAEDLQTAVPVVVKLLLFGPDFTWDDLKLFEREAQVLQSLSHAAIPAYLDCFETETELGKGFALVQTYIQARSLQAWIKIGRTFSESELKAIATDLLGILDYLHSRQPSVVHRDIKPSNILLGDRSGNSPGQVYLIDFGSVQTVIHGGTRTIVGTYGYMPPEQFGGQATPASDLYALGATLIYLATGQHPDQLLQQNLRIAFCDRVNLSPQLVDWLTWLTEPSLELRLRSAKQALQGLNQPTPRSQSSSLKVTSKPIDSKVQLTKTKQMLEILIPPRGFHLGLDPMFKSAILWGSFLLVSCCIAYMIMSPAGLFLAIWIFYLCLILGFGLRPIFFLFFGKMRLRITSSEISLSCHWLGETLSFNSVALPSAVRIELSYVFYGRNAKGQTVPVPPKILIWLGKTSIPILGADLLSTSELDWLAQELSDWLNVPITKV
jgi:serine/threonine protein kinase